MIIHPINNLRLLSVTLVLLYHYFPGRVPGGLIGVDIFFFISGYLMALLIDKNDNMSAWFFLKRRIDRLVPSLLIYLIFVILVYSLVLFPQQKPDFFNNIISSITFTKNLQLSYADTYFVGNKFDDPTLILWSLSVEFQAYLIFAFVLLFVKSKYQKHCILLLTSTSIIYFLVNYFYGGDNFYTLYSRFWQLGIGAVAYFYLGSLVLNFNTYVKVLGTVISVVSILYLSVYHVSDLIWPTLDVFLLPFFIVSIISLNMKSIHPTSIVYPLTYEIYMYHWLFLCLGVTILDMSTAIKVSLLFGSFIVSFIAFYMTKLLNYKKLVLLGAVSLVIFFVSPSVRSTGDYNQLIAQSDFPQSCKKDIVCIYGNPHARKILVVGDSHAELLSHTLYQSGYDNTLARIRGCDFIMDKNCLQTIQAQVNVREFESIIVSVCSLCNNPTLDLLKNDKYLEGLLKLRRHHSGGMIIVSDNPVGDQFNPRSRTGPDAVVVDSDYFSYIADQKSKLVSNGFIFLDLNEYLCDAGCIVVAKDQYLYSDSDHLRPWALKEFDIIEDLIKLTRISGE